MGTPGPTPAGPSERLKIEEGFRLLIEGIRDYAIFLLDPGGHVVTWNPGAERMNGYRPDEIIGQHFSRFYPADERRARKPERKLLTAAEEGRAEDEGWRVRKDGSRFWASVVITALKDAQGTVIGFGKITRDLSERKVTEQALQRSEESFRLLVDSIKDYGIITLDPEGRVVSWNDGAGNINGYRADEILGQHFSRFFLPEDLAGGKPDRLMRAALRHGQVEDEGWRVRKDGSRFWADVLLTAMRDPTGALIGYSKVTRDLSDRRRAEEELARTNTELETFSYSVSHDLRAPLRAIDGYAQALLEDHAAKLDAEGRRLLTNVRGNAQRMGQLIDALLSFSRLGRQAVHIGPVDMADLVASVLDDLRHAKNGVVPEVTVQALPPALGDKTLIRQVLANLLANAVKFSRGKERPEVEIGGRLEGQEGVYYVKDNGVGFDMQYADKLFRVFSRLHHANEFEGTGVGLALVQRIIQRHGGRVWAQSTPDKGATFYFTLPRDPGGV